MSQSQPLRIEHPDFGSFGTVRTVNSQLWFVNNEALEDRMLGWLGRYGQKYEVELYAFAIMGNHHQEVMRFPKCNRALFYRDFNARTAEAVRKLVPGFKGGPLVERRYSEQALPLDEDLEDRFFYCALQAIDAGLAEKIAGLDSELRRRVTIDDTARRLTTIPGVATPKCQTLTVLISTQN